MIFSLLLFSCCKDTTKNKKLSKIESNNSSVNQKLENEKKLYELDFFSKTVTENWLNFHELSKENQKLDNKDYSFFINNKTYIQNLFKSLRKSIPKEIENQAVISRISVVETRFLILESEFSNIETSPLSLEKNIQNIKLAFSNLCYQINKSVERSNQLSN